MAYMLDVFKDMLWSCAAADDSVLGEWAEVQADLFSYSVLTLVLRPAVLLGKSFCSDCQWHLGPGMKATLW